MPLCDEARLDERLLLNRDGHLIGRYEEAILRDLERLGIVPNAISHTSDWFELIKSKAEDMIKGGIAYVDPSPQEEQQKGRFEKTNSKYRDTCAPPPRASRLHAPPSPSRNVPSPAFSVAFEAQAGS